jgi:hypothetical protein
MTDLAGTRFADLYAGSGAVGLEAVSRGAAYALLVESDAEAGRVIRKNLAVLGTADRATLVSGKVATVLRAGPPDRPYDVVFADPPYDARGGAHRRAGGTGRRRMAGHGRGGRGGTRDPVRPTRLAAGAHRDAQSPVRRDDSLVRSPIMSSAVSGLVRPATNGHLDVIGRASRLTTRSSSRCW